MEVDNLYLGVRAYLDSDLMWRSKNGYDYFQSLVNISINLSVSQHYTEFR